MHNDTLKFAERIDPDPDVMVMQFDLAAHEFDELILLLRETEAVRE